MSKQLKLKEGNYYGHLNSFGGDVYRIAVQVKDGKVFLFEDIKASERVGDDAKPLSNEGEINWLFVFGVGFLAIAAFHLFVK